MVRLYKAYIPPHLEYCGPLLIVIGKVQAQRLEDTSYYILRTVLRLSKSISCDQILNYVKINSLNKCKHYQSLVLLYKALNNLGPLYLNEFFKLKIVKYNLRGTGTLPHFNLEWVHKSFSYVIANLWNSLPVKIRKIEGVGLLKRVLQDYMF